MSTTNDQESAEPTAEAADWHAFESHRARLRASGIEDEFLTPALLLATSALQTASGHMTGAPIAAWSAEVGPEVTEAAREIIRAKQAEPEHDQVPRYCRGALRLLDGKRVGKT